MDASKRTLHDGRQDGLTPLESLNLNEVDSFGRRGLVHMDARNGRIRIESQPIPFEQACRYQCRVLIRYTGTVPRINFMGHKLKAGHNPDSEATPPDIAFLYYARKGPSQP